MPTALLSTVGTGGYEDPVPGLVDTLLAALEAAVRDDARELTRCCRDDTIRHSEPDTPPSAALMPRAVRT